MWYFACAEDDSASQSAENVNSNANSSAKGTMTEEEDAKDIIYALVANDLNRVKKAIELGVSPSDPISELGVKLKMTPLMMAVGGGEGGCKSLDIIRFLIQSGADLSIKRSDNGKTAYDVAIENHRGQDVLDLVRPK